MDPFSLSLINEEQLLALLEATVPAIPTPSERLPLDGILSCLKLTRAERSFEQDRNAFRTREVQLCAERDELRMKIEQLNKFNIDLKAQQKSQAHKFQTEREMLQAQAQKAVSERLKMSHLLLNTDTELQAKESELEKTKMALAEAKTENDELQKKMAELKADLEDTLRFHEQFSTERKTSLHTAEERAASFEKKLDGWEEYSEDLKQKYLTYRTTKYEQDRKISFLEAKIERLENNRIAKKQIQLEEMALSKKQTARVTPKKKNRSSLKRKTETKITVERPAKRQRLVKLPTDSKDKPIH